LNRILRIDRIRNVNPSITKGQAPALVSRDGPVI